MAQYDCAKRDCRVTCPPHSIREDENVKALAYPRLRNRTLEAACHVLFTNFGVVVRRNHGADEGSLKSLDAGDAGIYMRYVRNISI